MELNLAPQGKSDLIKDGSEATFMADVIEASREVPVIVDFWAPWCGPCKSLGPVLEKAVNDAKGKVRLVKVDVDQNQRIAAQLQVQSIPAVFAFVNGQPVDGFMGAQQPAQIKAFVDRLIQMSGGNDGLEEALAAAEQMLEEGAIADAAQTFGAILERTTETPLRFPASREHTSQQAISTRPAVFWILRLRTRPTIRRSPPRVPASNWPRQAPVPLRPKVACARRSRPIPTTIRRGTISPWRLSRRATRGLQSTCFSISSAVTANGTAAPRRSSCSRSSIASDREATWPRKAAAACPP